MWGELAGAVLRRGLTLEINLRTHLMPQMKEFIAANEEWLTVFHFPVYAPDLNSQEGIWSLSPSR
uniref:transposase n=1 Tax=Streptomyces mirabilis TaxID=68239 RepID=UPI0036F1DB7C